MPVAGDRVVITGIGAVTAFGWSSRKLWRGLEAGRTSIGVPQRFDTSGQRTEIASEVPEAPPGTADPFAEWEDLSQADRFAVAAAHEAIRQAGLAPRSAPISDGQLGVFFGGSTAGMAEAESYFAELLERRSQRPDHRALASQPLNGPGDAVARHLGASGPVLSLSSACASGALAIATAVAAVREGEIELAVAGGADSLCQLTYSGFNSLRAVDEVPCRPFREERAGLSLGEGAGCLVLETAEHARQRGVAPLAILSGAGATCDAFHMTAPDPEGRGAARAIRKALEDASLEPGEIDFVNAHGTGTPHNDLSEWHALQEVFGPTASSLPVTSTKSYIGHLLGAAGAIEAVATAFCLLAGRVHPTAGDGSLDPASQVDLVIGQSRTVAKNSHAVSTSFAFGGANAALIIGGCAEAPEGIQIGDIDRRDDR